MLSVKLEVNGIPIGFINIHNVRYKDNVVGKECEYEYDLVMKDQTKKGTLIHKRNDGALVLIEKVIKHAGKQK